MSVFYNKKLISGVREVPKMPKAERDALTNKPDLWVRTDAPESDRGISASDVEYSTGVSVEDKIDDMDKSALLFSQLELSTTETAYNCNWQNYKYLIICACRYDNICSNYFMPKSYIESTNIGARVLCRDNIYDKTYSIRHNGNGSIYITASATDSTCGVKIWGVDEI